jgi:hypothetical protein
LKRRRLFDLLMEAVQAMTSSRYVRFVEAVEPFVNAARERNAARANPRMPAWLTAVTAEPPIPEDAEFHARVLVRAALEGAFPILDEDGLQLDLRGLLRRGDWLADTEFWQVPLRPLNRVLREAEIAPLPEIVEPAGDGTLETVPAMSENTQRQVVPAFHEDADALYNQLYLARLAEHHKAHGENSYPPRDGDEGDRKWAQDLKIPNSRAQVRRLRKKYLPKEAQRPGPKPGRKSGK